RLRLGAAVGLRDQLPLEYHVRRILAQDVHFLEFGHVLSFPVIPPIGSHSPDRVARTARVITGDTGRCPLIIWRTRVWWLGSRPLALSQCLIVSPLRSIAAFSSTAVIAGSRFQSRKSPV